MKKRKDEDGRFYSIITEMLWIKAISIREGAKLIGTTPQNLNGYINSGTNIKLSKVFEFAEKLGISDDYLFEAIKHSKEVNK